MKERAHLARQGVELKRGNIKKQLSLMSQLEVRITCQFVMNLSLKSSVINRVRIERNTTLVVVELDKWGFVVLNLEIIHLVKGKICHAINRARLGKKAWAERKALTRAAGKAALMAAGKKKAVENKFLIPIGIALYYAATCLITAILGLNTPLFNTYLNSYSLAIYYLVYAIPPVLSIIVIRHLLSGDKLSKINTVMTFVLAFTAIENCIMSIDAAFNLKEWRALNKFDLIMQGAQDWIVPIGLIDLSMIGILVLWLIGYLRAVRFL